MNTVDSDVFYDGGVGLTEQQREDIRGAIGTRPVAMVLLAEDGPRESDVCRAVSPRIPDVLDQVQIRDDLDGALAEMALAVVDATPDDPRGGRVPRPTGPPATSTCSPGPRSARGGWAGLLREARILLDEKVRS